MREVKNILEYKRKTTTTGLEETQQPVELDALSSQEFLKENTQSSFSISKITIVEKIYIKNLKIETYRKEQADKKNKNFLKYAEIVTPLITELRNILNFFKFK